MSDASTRSPTRCGRIYDHLPFTFVARLTRRGNPTVKGQGIAGSDRASFYEVIYSVLDWSFCNRVVEQTHFNEFRRDKKNKIHLHIYDIIFHVSILLSSLRLVLIRQSHFCLSINTSTFVFLYGHE